MGRGARGPLSPVCDTFATRADYGERCSGAGEMTCLGPTSAGAILDLAGGIIHVTRKCGCTASEAS